MKLNSVKDSDKQSLTSRLNRFEENANINNFATNICPQVQFKTDCQMDSKAESQKSMDKILSSVIRRRNLSSFNHSFFVVVFSCWYFFFILVVLRG